jgi:hypothetical protein
VLVSFRVVPLLGGGGAGAAPRREAVLGEDREPPVGGGGGGALDRNAVLSSCSLFSLIHDMTNSLLSSNMSSVTPILANSALNSGSKVSANDDPRRGGA